MKINYTNLTFTELVNKIGNSRFFDLPKMLKEILSRINTLIQSLTTRVEVLETSTEPKYKVYTALLTQTGTDAPVATVLENTLGGDIVWSYKQTGLYTITSDSKFIQNKLYVSCGQVFDSLSRAGFALEESSFPNTLDIYCKDYPDEFVDSVLYCNVEIRVYN